MKKVRSELFIDRRKLLLYNVTILLLSFLAWFVITYFKPDFYKTEIAIFLTIIFYVIFTNHTWILFYKSPHLKIYDDGIEFDDLGFWKWEEIGGVFDGNQQAFRLICKNKNLPKKSKKTSTYSYVYEEIYDTAFVEYKYPEYVTNIPPKEFYKSLLRYAPQERKTKMPLSKVTLKTLIWGVETPSLKRVFTITVSFIFSGLAFYAIFTQDFFISDQWNIIATSLIWAITITCSAAYYWAYAKGTLKLKHGQKKLSPIVLVSVPFIIFLLLWLSTALGLGRAYTKIYGIEVEKTITVKKKKHDPNCLDSEDLQTGYFQQIRVKEGYYKKILESSSLRIQGKESWFGFIFEKYAPPQNK